MPTPVCLSCGQKTRTLAIPALGGELVCTNCGALAGVRVTSGATITTRDPSLFSQLRLLSQILIALVLHSEEECLVYTTHEKNEAKNYELEIKNLDDEEATVLTVMRKR